MAMCDLPLKFRVTVPRSQMDQVVGVQMSHNAKPFRGHPPKTVVLIRATVYTDTVDQVTIEYEWRQAEQLSGVAVEKYGRPVDFNSLPGVKELA